MKKLLPNRKNSASPKKAAMKDTPLGGFFDSMVFAASIAKRGFDKKIGILPHMTCQKARRKKSQKCTKKQSVTV